jgi:hypothetical protein
MPEIEYVDVPTMRSVPSVTIPYRDAPVNSSVITFGSLPDPRIIHGPYEPVKYYEPISTISPAVVEAVPITPMYKDPYAIQPYVQQHTFTNDVWTEILKPFGIGVGVPIAGAAMFVGGVVVGAGALAGACAVGLLSTVRGAFGFVQIGTDYILHPISHGIEVVAQPIDQLDDKITGEQNTYSNPNFMEWIWKLFFGASSTTKAITYEPPVIIEERFVEPTYDRVLVEERVIRPTYVSGGYYPGSYNGSYRSANVLSSQSKTQPLYF